MTADSISADDLISEVNSAATIIDETTGANVTTASSLLASSSSSSENIQFYLFWYHTLGWLWVHNTVMAVTMTSIAAGVSFWYFAGEDGRNNSENEAKKKIPMAYVRGLGRVFRYHFGSMLFGAAIIAIVQLARMILAYVDSQTKQWQNKSKFLKIMFKVVA